MQDTKQDIYGGDDPREVAAYSITEAARLIKVPPTTLRPWVAGREYHPPRTTFSPLILTPEQRPYRLSFHNLIEAHVLRSLRVNHKISIEEIRLAIEDTQKIFGIERLLLSQELYARPGEIFLKKYGEFISLSIFGQLGMKKFFEAHLERIRWDPAGLPIQLYPFIPDAPGKDSKIIVIDARRAFGRPTLTRRGISTAVIVDRINAGESEQDIAVDYSLEEEEVEAAILYEYQQAA